jgi:hypothetical protein
MCCEASNMEDSRVHVGHHGERACDNSVFSLWPFNKKRETTKDAKDTKTTDAKNQELKTEKLLNAVGGQNPITVT